LISLIRRIWCWGYLRKQEIPGMLFDTDLIWNVMAHSLRQNSEYLEHVPNDRASRNSFSISIKFATRMHISEFLRFATSDVVGAALNHFAQNQLPDTISRGTISVSGWLFPRLGQYVETRLAEGRKRNGFKLSTAKNNRFTLNFATT